MTVVRGDRRTGTGQAVTDASTGSATFAKPLDNIGAKSTPDYAAYAAQFIRPIAIPGCSTPGRVFVGQRQDGFVVNLGETFDLVNIKYPVTQLAPAGTNGRNLAPDSLAGYNVTSIALEVPASCLTAGGDPVIGGWTTASLRQASVLNPQPQSAKSAASVGAVNSPTGASLEGGAWSQVSRLGMPLVNELVIGLPDKDRFNASAPSGDAQFADYVTNPALARAAANPVRIGGRHGAERVSAHRSRGGVPHRHQGPESAQGGGPRRGNAPEHEHAGHADRRAKRSGRAGRRLSGFPNGRRPIDDVVDIELRVAMGVLLTPFDGGASDPDPASDASRQLRLHRRRRARSGQLSAGVPLSEHGARRLAHQRQRLKETP